MADKFWFTVDEITDLVGNDGRTVIGRLEPGHRYRAVRQDEHWAAVPTSGTDVGFVARVAVRPAADPPPHQQPSHTRPADTVPTLPAAGGESMADGGWFTVDEITDLVGNDGRTVIGRLEPGRRYRAVRQDEHWAAVPTSGTEVGFVAHAAVRLVPPTTKPQPTLPTKTEDLIRGQDETRIMGYPVDFDVDYADGQRNRWLGAAGVTYWIKWLLLIPHQIVLFVLVIAAYLVGWVGYFVVLFTGKRLPPGMHDFLAGTIGWGLRTQAWFYSNVDQYPPFEMRPVTYPAEFTESDGDPRRNRLLGLAGIFGIKLLLAIPHLIALAFVGLAASIGAWIGFWIILFTGKLPEGIHKFTVGTTRWAARLVSWIASLTDRYPPFSLT